MYGNFSEETLELLTSISEDFAETSVLDFARCQRSDGTFYGTSGRCRKGSEAGAAPEKKETPRQKLNREELENPKLKADMDHEGLKKLMAKSPTAKRKLKEEVAAHNKKAAAINQGKADDAGRKMRELEKRLDEAKSKGDYGRAAKLQAAIGKARKIMEDSDERASRIRKAGEKAPKAGSMLTASDNKRREMVAAAKARQQARDSEAAPAPKAKKPRASLQELKAAQQKLYDEAKVLRQRAKEDLAEWKRVSMANKNNKTPEGRKAILEAGKKADRSAEALRRTENKWTKAHERWTKAGERANRAKMTPEQRAEQRRLDKIIKEQG